MCCGMEWDSNFGEAESLLGWGVLWCVREGGVWTGVGRGGDREVK